MTTTVDRGAATAALAARIGLRGNFKTKAPEPAAPTPAQIVTSSPKPVAKGRAAAAIRMSEALGLKGSFSHQAEPSAPPRRVTPPALQARVTPPSTPLASPTAASPGKYAIFRFPSDANRTLQQVEGAIGSPLGPVAAGKVQRFDMGDLQAYSFRASDVPTLTRAAAVLKSFGVTLTFGAVRTNGRTVPIINSAAVAGLGRLAPKGTAK